MYVFTYNTYKNTTTVTIVRAMFFLFSKIYRFLCFTFYIVLYSEYVSSLAVFCIYCHYANTSSRVVFGFILKHLSVRKFVVCERSSISLPDRLEALLCTNMYSFLVYIRCSQISVSFILCVV